MKWRHCERGNLMRKFLQFKSSTKTMTQLITKGLEIKLRKKKSWMTPDHLTVLWILLYLMKPNFIVWKALIMHRMWNNLAICGELENPTLISSGQVIWPFTPV